MNAEKSDARGNASGDGHVTHNPVTLDTVQCLRVHVYVPLLPGLLDL